MKKLFLLDAYALIYRSYYAFIRRPAYNSKGLNTSAILGFTNSLYELLQREKPSHMAVVFDPPTLTFRHEIYPEYKATRHETPEDIKLSIPYIKEIISCFNIKSSVVDRFEADDVIGTLALKAEKEGFQVFMVTPDKDYGQLVSDNIFMYKPRHSGNEISVLGVAEINALYGISSPSQLIDILALHGDASDNIPGAKGIGGKTSQKLISQFGSAENVIKNISSLSDKLQTIIENSRDNILLSKQLATINIDVPIDFVEDEFKVGEIKKEPLRTLFREMEFRELTKKIIDVNEEVRNVSVSQPVQGSLFDTPQQQQVVVNTSFFKTINDVPHKYSVAGNEEEIKALADLLQNSGMFSFDTETTSLDIYNAEIVGLSFSVKQHEAYYIPLPADRQTVMNYLEILKPVFSDKKILKVGQNIKFDLHILKNYSLEVEGPFFDTMIAHYLLDPGMRHNLNLLAETYLEYSPVPIENLIGKKDSNQRSMRTVDLNIIKDYACEDADITLQLKEVFVPMLKEKGLDFLAEKIEMPLVPVLTDMERSGITVDNEALNKYSIQLNNDIDVLKNEIFELAGTEFNISSPKQLGDILFEKMNIDSSVKKTKTQQYPTSEETLVKLSGKHIIIDKVLKYRSLTKLLSTYVDALPRLINTSTGKIHTTFNQAIVSTGRLSSQNPNLQNIPIRTEDGQHIRKAFIASNNEYMLMSADYSQIELRLMAHISDDQTMIDAFLAGHDIHSATAAKIYKTDISSVTVEQRRMAKTANFGIIYGVTSFGLSQQLNISKSDAKILIDEYFNTYKKVHEYMSNAVALAKEKAYAETIFGRRRYLKDINSRNAVVRGFAERNAINMPIQGSSADIIKLSMIRIQDILREKNLRSKMILQVHDELVFDIYKPEAEQMKQLVKDIMQNVYQLKVPLVADVGTGINWLEAH